MAAAAGSEDGGAATTAMAPGYEQLPLLSAEGVGRSAVPSSPEDPAPKLLHYGLTLSVPDPQPPHLDTATMRKAGDWALPYDGPGGHLSRICSSVDCSTDGRREIDAAPLGHVRATIAAVAELDGVMASSSFLA